MIKITVNGKERELESEMSVATFLRKHGREPRLIVVELNGEIIRFPDFERITIKDGDTLEIAHMVAGGAHSSIVGVWKCLTLSDSEL